MRLSLAASCFVFAALPTLLRADDVYFAVPLPQLTLTQGALPAEDGENRRWGMMDVLRPYAVLDGPGEAVLTVVDAQPDPWSMAQWSPQSAILTVKAPGPGPVTGRLFVPDADWTKLVSLSFTIPADAASRDARRTFNEAVVTYYDRLQSRDFPGGAWFRYRADTARKELPEPAPDAPRRPPFRRDDVSLADTYNLFTGGRAVAENLQLPRGLPPPAPAGDDAEKPVPLGSLEGITVRSFDWPAMLASAGNPAPAIDALATYIPADQHAVFFPSFAALMKVLDQTDEDGLPVFRSVRPRSEDARLTERYQKQLGLHATRFARALGLAVIRSVAVTGSDPYFPTGTDVAVLFEAADAAALRPVVLSQVMMSAAASPASEKVSGEIDGVKYDGAVSPDREVCAYVAGIGDAVIVTNSLAQLRRLAAVGAKQSESLAALPEFRFFRARYPAADPDETAFLFLSDPTIRRWCGPRWRIATSRRLRADAVMSDLTAAHANEVLKGTGPAAEIRSEVPMQTIGTLTLGPGSVTSSVYGRSAFLTPIVELDITEVTPDEASSYKRWRDTYQQNWSWAFDPIGISFGIGENRVRADVTVMPLILGSRYATWMNIARGATIAPRAGDPHETLAHGVLAVNVESEAVRNATGMARMFAPDLNIDPLSWLGQSVALYADPDPYWQEMLAATNAEDFVGEHIDRLPVALYAEVSSPLKLTAFLAAARSFVDQSSPGITAWETLKHNDQPYVKVGLSESARAQAGGDAFDRIAIYYAPTPRALIVSLNEEVLKRALDRQSARAGNAEPDKPAAGAAPYWIGQSMGLRFTDAGLALVQGPGGEAYRSAMQQRAWSNLPILNEWKRQFPDLDPVEVHEKLFGVRLIDPAGGKYIWNEPFRTMESTVYGHAGEPRPGPGGLGVLDTIRSGNLGLTFEASGLRARAEIERNPAAPAAK
ncbi:MAG: hypothetical protein IT436_16480 [Phycisphaerales bacterium]|nr:hypothetical protein [Phycisphaerales bacterium]